MRLNTLIVEAAALVMAAERLLSMLAPEVREKIADRLLAPRRSKFQRVLSYAASHPKLTAQLGTYAFAGGVMLATALSSRRKQDATPKVAS